MLENVIVCHPFRAGVASLMWAATSASGGSDGAVFTTGNSGKGSATGADASSSLNQNNSAAIRSCAAAPVRFRGWFLYKTIQYF